MRVRPLYSSWISRFRAIAKRSCLSVEAEWLTVVDPSVEWRPLGAISVAGALTARKARRTICGLSFSLFPEKMVM